MREYLLATFVAAAVTYLVAGPVRAVAVRFGVLAEVRDRDVHDVPIPRLGGVAMVVGLAAALLVASKMPLLRSVFATGDEPKGVLLAAVVICLIGVVDDVWGLDAITKLAGQSLAAGLMALQGVQLLWLPGPGQTIALGPAEGTLITVLVVVVTVNAVNFVDGLDGLAAGIVGISASAFFLFSYLLSVQNAIERALTPSLISAVLAGVCAGFLVHNFNPARIFMGDSGSMVIGLLLAASSITLTGRLDPASYSGLNLFPTLLPLLLPFAVLAVPFLDLVLAVVRRTRARRSPFAADKQHLHHRLLEIGHSHRRAVLIMYGWTALLAYLAVGLAFLPTWLALALAAVAFAALVVVVRGPRRAARAAAGRAGRG